MSRMDDRNRLFRQTAKLDARASGVTTDEESLQRFRDALADVDVDEQALADTIGDRLHKHLEHYAKANNMLTLQGVQELLFIMWTEGFMVGSGYVKEKLT